ncbi:hypothetical protein Tco_0485981, partial [Tanacetum coccineum]
VDKRVWFEVELHGAQGDREAEVFQVRANIMVTGVYGQEAGEGTEVMPGRPGGPRFEVQQVEKMLSFGYV